jgi:hypothetical protein
MRTVLAAVLSLALAACGSGTNTVSPTPAGTSGGFIATLGADTVHVERFTRVGNRIEGTIITRTPAFRSATWSLSLSTDGAPARYDVETRDASGAVVAPTGAMVYASDTIVREALRNGQRETQRVPIRSAAFPSPSLPYIGVSYLMLESAIGDARRRGDSVITQLTMIPAQLAPQRTRTWFPSPDSAEVSYFGVAKSGYRFDAAGKLVHADWRGTTYAYDVKRVGAVDVDATARGWRDAELRGAGFGALSPRDTARGSVGPVHITIDYGRPARRGRVIWGSVVPWERVWRLGADVATHMTTTADLMIGETLVPAGRYTLWMFASATEPKLIVNSAVNIFGTNYNAARDFARIPLTRRDDAATPERLQLRVVNNVLSIEWGDVVWSAALRAK